MTAMAPTPPASAPLMNVGIRMSAPGAPPYPWRLGVSTTAVRRRFHDRSRGARLGAPQARDAGATGQASSPPKKAVARGLDDVAVGGRSLCARSESRLARRARGLDQLELG